MPLKYINDIPHVLDAEVRAAALRIFHDSRSIGGGFLKGNDTLKHCEHVAATLVRTYVLMDNEGGNEYARLYAKVADLFGALADFSSGCQTRIKYRHLHSDLFGKVSL